VRGSPHDKPSIAVLPFVNLSDDVEQEYFSDGITYDIITALASSRWLFVVARNSFFSYKGETVDVRQIAADLNVKYVLEGSVRRSRDRVRVTAHLVDGQTGVHLWTERYDRDLSDILTLQDDITSVIAARIEPELGVIEGGALRNRQTGDLNARECQQRGLWHLFRFTPDDLDKAKDLFTRAIDLSPGFAQAYARLAYTYIQLTWHGPPEDKAHNITTALKWARRAVELDDQDPSARLSHGRALTLTGEMERGVEELRAVVELNPSFAQGYFALGQALCWVSRPEEALPMLDRAIALNPRDPHLWNFYQVRGIAHYLMDDLERAEADVLTSLRYPNATHWAAMSLATILGRRDKDKAEIAAVVERLLAMRPGFTCEDVRKEFYIGGRSFFPEDVINRYISDIRKAGLPE